MGRVLVYIALASFVWTQAPVPVFAHALGVDCRLRDGKVEVEAFYDDDTPAAKAKVQVRNAKDDLIAAGVTDAKGKWTFAAPAPGKYVVHVDAGAGHRARKSIQVPGADHAFEPPVSPSESISEWRTRAEFTSTPWLKIAIGLTVIGACGGAFVIAMRLKKNGKTLET